MTKAFRITFTVLLWIIGILLGILLLVFVLLQIPAVQQRVAQEAVKIGRSTLDTDLGIGSVDIDFPSRIQLDDVYHSTDDTDE